MSFYNNTSCSGNAGPQLIPHTSLTVRPNIISPVGKPMKIRLNLCRLRNCCLHICGLFCPIQQQSTFPLLHFCWLSLGNNRPSLKQFNILFSYICLSTAHPCDSDARLDTEAAAVAPVAALWPQVTSEGHWSTCDLCPRSYLTGQEQLLP